MVAMKVYNIFLLFTGAALTGSLYFNKMNFIKTALFASLLCVAAFALNWLIAVMLFSEIREAGPFHDVVVAVGDSEGEINLPQKAFSIYAFMGDCLFPVMLWCIPFIRLKEKEF
jgi:hypothetical protein